MTNKQLAHACLLGLATALAAAAAWAVFWALQVAVAAAMTLTSIGARTP